MESYYILFLNAFFLSFESFFMIFFFFLRRYIQKNPFCSVSGLEKASGLQSLGLSECPYLTDDVLHRVGQLRRLRRLRLDLTACDKATAAGVLDMLSGSERLHELYLTMPLSAAHVDAAARAASLRRLQLFWLTFERLSFEDHLDNQPADDGWHRTLAARFRGDVDFRVGQTFTRIVVTAD